MRPNTRIWIIILLCICNLLYTHYFVFLNFSLEIPITFPIFIDNMLGVFIDFLLIAAVTLLLGFLKPLPSLTITYTITWLWSFCNLIYARFFETYISLSSLEQSSSVFDPLLIRCIYNSFDIVDFFFVLSLIIFVLLIKDVVNKKRAYKTISINFSIIVVSLICIDFVTHVSFCAQSPLRRNTGYLKYYLYNRHISSNLFMTGTRSAVFTRGYIRTLWCEWSINANSDIILTEQQEREINRYISLSKQSINTNHQRPTYIENVIFILVESYMSFTSDLKIDNQEITPNLNKLKHDPQTYYNGNMHPNITIGESSDGQFIYISGLLPLRSMVTIARAQKNKIHGLAEILSSELGMSSLMIIPTTASMWNQDKMCKCYGYKYLYTNRDYPEAQGKNLNDEQVFDLAARVDTEAPKPFFLTILTMSMHQPYTTDLDPTFHLVDKSLSSEQLFYLKACHYTDSQIGKYIEHLKKVHLYEKSMIIIAADHHVKNISPNEGKYGTCYNIPLYIINGGIDNSMAYQGEFNQLDMFPTVLNALAIYKDWNGLGHSLLDIDYNYSLNKDLWKVSEWITFSNYFAHYSNYDQININNDIVVDTK